jgi:hypothetical protein
LVVDVSPMTDIIDLDHPMIIVDGVNNPEPFRFEGFEFGQFFL